MTATETAPESAPAPETRRRIRRPDPLVWLSCAAALAVYLLHGFDGRLTRDLGVYSYGGQQVAEGVAPYVAIVNRAGPLGHLIPGIGVIVGRAFGADDVLSMRVLNMLLSIVTIGLIYVLGRDLFRSRLAGLATAAAMLCFQGFITYATYGPREKTAMVLFVVLALLAMLKQRWGTTGFFIALATLTWQPVFLAAIAGAAIAAWLGLPSGRFRALVRIAVGGAIPTVITVGFYAAIGELQVFLDDFLLINARYTKQVSLLDTPDYLWKLMHDAYGWSLWVFIVGSLAQLALTAVVLTRRTTRRTPRGAALAGTGVVFVVGVLWSLKAFNGWPDAFFLLPGAALGIGGVAVVLARWLPSKVALVAVLVWALAATGMAVDYSVSNRDDTLDGQRADVDAVMELLPADATMLSVESPEPLVLAHKRNISRYQLLGNGLIDYLDDTWPGGEMGYGRWVGEQAPTVIAVGSDQIPGWLSPTLENYRRVGRSVGWFWYVRRDVGPETLAALSDELHDRT